MNPWKDLFDEVPASFSDRVQNTLAGLEEQPVNLEKRMKKVRPAGRIATIAAAAAVLLIGTAFAAELLHLDKRRGEVFVPEEPAVMEGYVAESPAGKQPETDLVYTTVSAIGVTGSPEYKAAQAWNDWCLANAEENVPFPEGMENYTPEEITALTEALQTDVYAPMGAYTDEARAALNSIAAEYGLQLPERYRAVTAKDLYDLTGETDLFPLDANSRAGRWFEGGSLEITNDAALNTGKTVGYSLFRSAKGMFSRPIELVTEQDITEEWTYTTADGTEVTLDLGPNRSVLMAELENSFVYVNIRGGTENTDPTRDGTGPDILTRADLEAFADAINFPALDRIQ